MDSKVNYNPGITILKMLAAYLVVCNHFGFGVSKPWNRLASIAVPVFMMLAFALGGSLWNNLCRERLVRRLFRLLLPFVFWGVFYWLVACFSTGRISIRSLIGQLIFGHTVCVPLYFYVLLMAFTCLVFVVKKYLRNFSTYVFVGFIVICFFLQYSEWNVKVVNSIPAVLSAGKFPLGRVAELLPSAIIGLAVFRVFNSERIPNRLFFSLGLFCLACSLLVPEKWMCLVGFGYQGLLVQVGAFGAVLMAFSANLTGGGALLEVPLMGIYCLHMFVGRIMKMFLPLQCGWMLSACVFLVSWAIAFLLSKGRMKRVVS